MCGTRKSYITSGLITTGISTLITFCILVWGGSIYNSKKGVKDSPVILEVLIAGFVGCLLCFILRVLQLRAHRGKGRVQPVLVSHHLLLFTQIITQIALLWHLVVTLAMAMALFLYRKKVEKLVGEDDWLAIPPAVDLIVFLMMFAHLFVVVVEMIKSCSERRVPEEDLTRLVD